MDVLLKKKQWQGLLPMNYQDRLPYQRQLHEKHERFLTLSEIDKFDYYANRRVAIKFLGGQHKAVALRSSGTRAAPKIYGWGPYFNEMYRFILDIVTNCSVRKRVAVQLAKSDFLSDTSFAYQHDLSDDHFIDTMLTFSIGKTRLDRAVQELLSNVDIIIDPNLLCLLDKHTGLIKHIGSDCRFFFTGSILTDEAKDLVSGFRYFDWMRSWDGGATFYTCQFGNKHWLNFVSELYRAYDGRLFSTDLYNAHTVHCDYFNGDIVEVNSKIGRCFCGLDYYDIQFQDRGRSLTAVSPNGQFYSYAVLRNILFKVKSDIKFDDVFYDVFDNEMDIVLIGDVDIQVKSEYLNVLRTIYDFKSVRYKDYLDDGHKVNLLRVR